jgi:hypothetical protein
MLVVFIWLIVVNFGYLSYDGIGTVDKIYGLLFVNIWPVWVLSKIIEYV